MKTQQQAILNHLRGGHCIDPLHALTRFGCNRLAARICDLRAAGHEIRTRLVSVRTRSGGKARIAVYSTPERHSTPNEVVVSALSALSRNWRR